MDYGNSEYSSDDELVNDILGPEDLFSDEAHEKENVAQSFKDTEGKIEIQDEDSKEKAEKKRRQPRVVKNPRIMLNFHSLEGRSGLSALKKLFINFKFKGNGHEKEDMTKIMEILQQWMCYQLCPSYDFESCMAQLEALGKKKVVQTLMTKYRLGMDVWGENKSNGDDTTDDYAIEVHESVNENNDLNLLLDEEIINAGSEPEPSQREMIVEQNKSPHTAHTEPEYILTQEQLERIVRNRKLATERKQKRMSALCEQMEVHGIAESNGYQDTSLEKINFKNSS